MSPRSSSGSASATRGVDVIDLDRFMRGVRPDRGRLVVDGGGRRSSTSSSSGRSLASGVPRRAPPPLVTAPHGKRFSHDSGLSDDSYGRHKRSRHRRVSAGDGPNVRGILSRESGRSLRAFRATCERELRDQRRQLARVAALCERLAEQRSAAKVSPRTSSRVARDSELSSSSRSTSDAVRRDEHRAEECKTYKIIMTKLDELNRVFLARRAASPRVSPARPSPPPPAPRSATASASVSVSDKIVTTDYTHKTNKVQKSRRSTETQSPRLVEHAVDASSLRANIRDERGDEHSVRVATVRAATPAFALETERKTTRVARSVNCESSGDDPVSTCDPRCGFDLDNPVHLYAQAKRLQAGVGDHVTRGPRPPGGGGSRPPGGGGSLCAVCRGYWRSLRLYVLGQLCRNTDQPTE